MRRIGIDLGTTNTCIYIASCPANEGASEFRLTPVIIYYKEKGDVVSPPANYSMPSAIYGVQNPDKNGYHFYVGEIAVRMAEMKGETELINTKRLLCNDDPDTTIEYGLTAEDIAGKLLKACYDSIKEELGGYKIDASDVCVTHPAAFGIFATTSIKNASSAAGFTENQTKPSKREPDAALLSYLYTQLNDPEKAQQLLEDAKRKNDKLLTLVIDIGGGTTDVTIQEISVTGTYEPPKDSENICATGYEISFLNQTEGESQNGTIAAANQEPAFGGLDFDSKIVENILRGLNAQYYNHFGQGVNWNTKDAKRFVSRLYKKVQEVKNGLIKHLGESDGIKYEDSFVQDDFEMHVSYTKKDIYEWTRELCYLPEGAPDSDRTVYGIIFDTIKRSGYNIDKIDRIFVTGGMSQYEPIRDMLKEKFREKYENKKLVFSANPLSDIAKGAAVCDIFFKVNNNVRLYSDLMLDDPVGSPCVLVKRNTELPYHDTIPNFTKLRNPSILFLDVLWGFGPDDCRMRYIMRKKQDLHHISPIGTPVSIQYEINTQQALNITAIIHDPRGDYEVSVVKLIEDISAVKKEEDGESNE